MSRRSLLFSSGSLLANGFIFDITVGVESITLPFTDFSDMLIDYGDGSAVSSSFTHNYTVAGTYTVNCYSELSGGFTVSNGAIKTKIVEIKNWGLEFTSLNFLGCSNLVANSVLDALNTSSMSSFNAIFSGCSSLTTINDINTWDTSNITVFKNAFSNSTFNDDISNWNTSSGVEFNGMFNGANSFNQNLNTVGLKWDVSNASDFRGMFQNTNVFNGTLTNWDTSSLTQCAGMFANALAFNQPLNHFDVSNVTIFNLMFFGANSFNQSLNSWTIKNTLGASVSFSQMFYNNTAFNQDISSWDTSEVTLMQQMFRNAGAFNQDIGGWDTSKVTNMSLIFYQNDAFDQDVSSWDISNVTNITSFGRESVITTANYDLMLNAWSLLTLQPNLNLTMNCAYTIATSQAARDILTNSPNNWTITDGGGI